jgi:DNA-binding MarR family transcriptional regulator
MGARSLARAERTGTPRRGAADALRRLVDRVSHRSGLALSAMSDAGVTLPQVLLLGHVEDRDATSPTEIAAAMGASLPASSQMIERLVQLGLLERTEEPADRRRKTLAITAEARALLRRLRSARSTDYERGLAPVARGLLVEMAALIERVLAELDGPGERAGGGSRGARKGK